MVLQRFESLHAIEQACWQELARAAQAREHDWRLLALATVDGVEADVRTVVLREAQAAQRSLVIYTDARSRKVGQLRQHPRASLLAWSPTLSWQLRIRVSIAVEDEGPEVARRWSQLQYSPAAQDYLSAVPPGEALLERQDSPGSRGHLALLRAQVQALDWLELHPEGHRRAVFDAQGARWVQP